MLSRDLWYTFDQMLLDHIMDQEEKTDERPEVLFDWVSYYKGMGLICPISMEARAQLQNLVSQVRINEYEFRAWTNEEIRRDSILIRLPPRYRDRSADSIFASIMRANPIAADDLQVEACDVRNVETGERLLRLHIERPALIALWERGGEIQLGPWMLPVWYRGKPLRDADDIQ